MSLRKRGSVWFIDFRTPNGERIRRSTETENKAPAKELHDKSAGSRRRPTKPLMMRTSANCVGSTSVRPGQN